MENLKEQIAKLIELMGFNAFQIEADPETKLFSVSIEDAAITATRLPTLVLNINRVVRLIAKRHGVYPVVIDINNFYKVWGKKHENSPIFLVYSK